MLTIDQIRKALQKSGKPIEYWAGKAGLSYWVLRRIFNGEGQDMKIENYHKLVRAIEDEG